MELSIDDDEVAAEMEATLQEIQTLRSELGMPGFSGSLSGTLPSVDMSGGFPGADASYGAAAEARRPTPIQLPDQQTVVGDYVVQDQRSGEGLLGEGGQANFETGEGGVFIGKHRHTNESVAVKKMHYAVLCKNPQRMARVRREAENAWRITHPNVIKLKDILFSPDNEWVYFIMERAIGIEGMPNADLFAVVSSRGPLSEDSARAVLKQLLAAIAHCHSLGICHRDLKPENILLEPTGQIKVTDFGMSKEFGTYSCNTREGIGTIAYNAPELFGESGVTGSYDPRPIDVWGIGVTLYVMTIGAYPFGTGRADEDYHETVSKICSPDFAHEPLPRGTSTELADLLAHILCVDVTKRYSVEQIAQHPWVVPGGVYTAPASVAPSPRPAKNWETLWPAPPPAADDFFTSPPSSLGSSVGWRSGSAGQGSTSSGTMQYHSMSTGGTGISSEMDDSPSDTTGGGARAAGLNGLMTDAGELPDAFSSEGLSEQDDELSPAILSDDDAAPL